MSKGRLKKNKFHSTPCTCNDPGSIYEIASAENTVFTAALVDVTFVRDG